VHAVKFTVQPSLYTFFESQYAINVEHLEENVNTYTILVQKIDYLKELDVFICVYWLTTRASPSRYTTGYLQRFLQLIPFTSLPLND